MTSTPILVISTTNRPASLTSVVSRYYVQLLQKKGIETSLLDLTLLPKDFTTSALYANKKQHPAFNALTHLVDIHTKYVFIVPQYNGSFPGVFKAFIDGYAAPHIFRSKKCALVGVSAGNQGAIMGLSHLSDILHYLGMTLYPELPTLPNITRPTLEAVKKHPHYLQRLDKQASSFIDF